MGFSANYYAGIADASDEKVLDEFHSLDDEAPF